MEMLLLPRSAPPSQSERSLGTGSSRLEGREARGDLESRNPDDVGLGVVGGTGGLVYVWRGAGCRNTEDSRGEVWLLAVQRERLLELGVQTGSTGRRDRRRRKNLESRGLNSSVHMCLGGGKFISLLSFKTN